MKQKILRYEFYLLLIFSSVATLCFYLQDQVTDNIYSINSDGSVPLLPVFWFNSVVVFLGGLTGPWSFLVFLGFALFYALIFAKREYWVDVFALPFLALVVLGICFFTLPGLLGANLRSYISQYIPSWILTAIILGAVAYLCFVLASAIRGIKDAWDKPLFGEAPILDKIVSKIKSFRNFKHVEYPTPSATVDISESMGEVASEDPLDLKQREEDSDPDKIENKIIKEAEDVVPSEVEQSHNVEDDVIELGMNEVEEIVDESKLGVESNRVGNTEKVIPTQQERFDQLSKINFNSQELISCIANSEKAKKIKLPEEGYFQQIIRSLEEKLSDFKVEGQIVNVLKGPVVDTFELELGTGIAVSRVTRLTEDLSLALKGTPIRIVYPLKGKHTIGIEVPRSPREIIYLDEVLRSSLFSSSQIALPIAMGKDAFGDAFVVDLASMPHMLVAGATGAGKSVFINTLLVSLLIKKGPKDLRFILIDPKQLELAVYQKLPHLIMPVVTEPQMASLSLLWAVEEMEKRYGLLKEMGVRNIERFNEKIKTAAPEIKARMSKYYEGREEQGWELPYIVIIVDEFADLILTKNGKEIENNICRLAAKARASGIHLVIATQRPSVDVITGLIKANFPTRVSFRVTSAVDSRTILNSMGAEKLLGKGDMLYKHGIEMCRLHSSYVDEDEIEVLIERLQNIRTTYYQDALEFLENGPNTLEGGGYESAGSSVYGDHLSDDELYREAVKIVVEHRAASASMLQRRLRIGYNRAANLIEEMEAKGVVGPQQGSKPRKVLMAPEGI